MTKFEQKIPGKDTVVMIDNVVLALAAVATASSYISDEKIELMKDAIVKPVIENLREHRMLNDYGLDKIDEAGKKNWNYANLFEAASACSEIEYSDVEKIKMIVNQISLSKVPIKYFIDAGHAILSGRVRLAIMEDELSGVAIRTRCVLDKVGLEMWNIYMDHKPAANLEELATLKATASEEDILILEDMLAE